MTTAMRLPLIIFAKKRRELRVVYPNSPRWRHGESRIAVISCLAVNAADGCVDPAPRTRRTALVKVRPCFPEFLGRRSASTGPRGSECYGLII